jgi:hypothetical protein
VFASIAPAAAAGSPGFSLNLSATSATVTPGGSAKLTIGAAAVGGFNNEITLTCSAPAGLTCSLSPSTISPGSNAASSTLTISAASTPPIGGYGFLVLTPGLGLFGTLLIGRKRKLLTRKNTLGISVLGSLLFISLFALGCGSNSNNKPTVSQTNVMVTGTSGSISHTSAVAVTIN